MDSSNFSFPKARATCITQTVCLIPRSVLFPLRSIDDVKTGSSIRHTFHLGAKGNEYRRKAKERREGKNGKGIAVPECIFLLSRFCRTRPYRVPTYPTASTFYPSILTFLLSCRALTFFFFVPEGNTEHLLREIKKKRLSGADARLRSSRCTRRRNDNSSRRILAFLIY